MEGTESWDIAAMAVYPPSPGLFSLASFTEVKCQLLALGMFSHSAWSILADHSSPLQLSLHLFTEGVMLSL